MMQTLGDLSRLLLKKIFSLVLSPAVAVKRLMY